MKDLQEEFSEEMAQKSWNHHRKRQLKELGIDPEESNE